VAHGFDPLDPASHPPALPTVVATVPPAGAAGVDALAPLSVTFSEPMDQGATTVALAPTTFLRPPEWSADGRTVTLRPDPALAYATAYLLSVESVDLEGYALVGTKSFAFTTGRGPAPLVANDVVRAFAEGPDGTVYLGGSFTRIGRQTGGGVPLDAVTAEVVEPFAEVTGYVHDAVPDGAGGWWVSGDFGAVNGVPRRALAHLLADGTLGGAFDAGFGEATTVDSIAVSGGRVFAWDYSGVRAFDAATGAELWYSGAGAYALLAVGSTVYAGETGGGMVALDAATGAVLPWDPGIDGLVYALAWTGNTLYVGGLFGTAGGEPRSNLAAFDAAGVLTSWNPGADSYVLDLAWSGTTLYAGGSFFAVGGETRHGLAAIDASGAVTSWNPGDYGTVIGELATDGSTVYAQGLVYTAGGETRHGLAAFDLAGGLLPWAPHPVDVPSHWITSGNGALAVSGGVVFVGGDFVGMGGEGRNGLAAVDVRGALLPWSPAAGPVAGVALLGSRVVALGDTLKAFEAASGALAWEVPYDLGAWSLVSNGTVAYLGGPFQTVGGIPRAGLAALDATGTVTAWNPGADGTPRALALGNGLVYAAGSFTSVGGEPRLNAAAIDASGTVTAWAPQVVGAPATIFATPDAVYLGGDFTEVNGIPRNDLAAIDLSGTLLPWAPELTATTYLPWVDVLVVEGSTVYIGGGFVWVNGVLATGVAAIDTSGAVQPGNRFASGGATALFVQGSRLWVGGDFNRLGGWPAQGFAVVER
jgi:hypothetical protein